MSVFGNRLKHVTCKTWDVTQPDFVFPEQGDPEFMASDVIDRPNLGLAFSGGATRSASATLGQLRGFKHIGLLDKVRYCSVVSGSSLAAVAFTYLLDAWTDNRTTSRFVKLDRLINEHDRYVVLDRIHELARLACKPVLVFRQVDVTLALGAR